MKKSSQQQLTAFSLAPQKREHDAAGNRGTEDTGKVRPHRMHQQEDAAAFLLPDEVGNARSDRNGGDTCGTDQRIDASAGEFINEFVCSRLGFVENPS